MKDEKKIVKISVRNLVEFIYRSGDITSTGSGASSVEAMQMGNKIHRKIQKSMGLGYESEVSLFTLQTLHSERFDEDFDLMIEGRADGIWHHDGIVTIDEIKGVFFDVKELKEPIYVHLAQAMCYSYIVLVEEGLPSIELQITYCHMETEQIKRLRKTYTKEEITEWFTSLVKSYEKWAVYQYDWEKQRNDSIHALEFPFPYREGQKELAAMAYHTIQAKKRLFIQAPTGVGKTITTVFPAIKAMGEGIGDRIFYLTAKTITRKVAEDCFTLLSEHNLLFKSLTITAKEKMCVLDKISCNPDDCPVAKGHYDRVNDAVFDLLTNEIHISREHILSYAKKHRVCPFEMCLDASLYADAVICDYNYVFDPNIYLRRFFTPDQKGNMIFLIDEAHNLIERGRECYSATLVKEDFLAVNRIVKETLRKEKRPEVQYNLRKFQRSLEAANNAMLVWKREGDDFQVLPDVGTFAFRLLVILANYELFSKDYPILPERETMVNFFFNVRNFSMILDRLDEKYRIYTDYNEENHFRIKLQCMDPSNWLKEVLDRGRSAIFFSATLLPINYYKEQLTGTRKDAAVYAHSSFSNEQRKLMIACDATSKYTRRGPDEYRRIADYIEQFVSAKEGNYMVFFPSYAFMDQVITRIHLPDTYTLLVQDSDMKEKDKEIFLESFESRHGVVGCCVMGGIFSEGIDLTDDRLIGAVIVGTGLPMVCPQRELFKDYYDEVTGNGFDYAYLYPGINKVFQAGGRVIRTASDRGAILLLDERFLQRQYLDLFPREWYPYDIVNIKNMKQKLEHFWNENSGGN